jgi:hypothetical protein
VKTNHPFTFRNSLIFIVLAVGVIFLLIRFAGGSNRHASANTGAAVVPALATKPEPKEITFHGCPPEGSGGDGALNILKNRVDEGDYKPVSTSAILSLSWPRDVERKRRDSWPVGDKREVDQHEGIPVSVEGFLLQVKEEGPESPNCRMESAADKDFHLWLASAADDERSSALVVEITPRVRAGHPEWTLATIRKIIQEKIKVRVSGWLLLDQEHPDQVGKTRGTLWEVHPITKIETEAHGAWQSLQVLD